MKKLSYFILTTVILLLVLGCEGPQGIQGPAGDYDKQITLMFPTHQTAYITNKTSGYILPKGASLLKFNKNNFINVDSIIFVAYMGSTEANNNCLAELYNLTDSTLVENSLIMTNDSYPHPSEWTESGNIFDYLPDYEIDLSIKIRTEHDGIDVGIYNACLYLYRN